MSVVAFLLCILVTTVTAIYLYRKLNPQGVLMLAGLVMLTFALILNVQSFRINPPAALFSIW